MRFSIFLCLFFVKKYRVPWPATEIDSCEIARFKIGVKTGPVLTPTSKLNPLKVVFGRPLTFSFPTIKGNYRFQSITEINLINDKI